MVSGQPSPWHLSSQDDNTISFLLGAYNPHEPVIIDPTYQWHTFYGTFSSLDDAYCIAVDTNSNVYVTGQSNDTWGSPLNARGDGARFDLFVLKLNSSGAYQWHTFYGGSDNDYAYGIATDANGNIYVTGVSSATWGTPLAPQRQR